MDFLRHNRRLDQLARLVLVWFVVSLGVAVASPLVKPQDVQMVCTSAGIMKMLVQGDDGGFTEASPHTLDCPLCTTASAPPPVPSTTAEPVFALGYALQPIPAAHIAARTAAPLPARGPPAL